MDHPIQNAAQHMNDNVPAVIHWLGIVGTTAATIAGWLPKIAALVSIIWGALQIYSWIINKRWRRKN